MRIQLGWGNVSVVFISHCSCCPNHRNLSAQIYIWFDHRIPLIRKISKLIMGAGRKSFPNRLSSVSTGSLEGHSHHVFHQFGGSCCLGSDCFSVINIRRLHWFNASNCSLYLLAWRHRGNVMSWYVSQNKGLNLGHHLCFSVFSAFFFAVISYKVSAILDCKNIIFFYATSLSPCLSFQGDPVVINFILLGMVQQVVCSRFVVV